MRTRSPSTAPPVKGLVGSTAIDADAPAFASAPRASSDRRECSCPRRAARSRRRHTRAPSFGVNGLQQLDSRRRFVFDERDRARERPAVAGEHASDEL